MKLSAAEVLSYMLLSQTSGSLMEAYSLDTKIPSNKILLVLIIWAVTSLMGF